MASFSLSSKSPKIHNKLTTSNIATNANTDDIFQKYFSRNFQALYFASHTEKWTNKKVRTFGSCNTLQPLQISGHSRKNLQLRLFHASAHDDSLI